MNTKLITFLTKGAYNLYVRDGDFEKAIETLKSFREIAVRDMLLENRDASFIHILPSCMKNGYRPDSRYLKPLQEGRFLEIGEGNDESEFGRSVCLTLNDEIDKFACAGEQVRRI